MSFFQNAVLNKYLKTLNQEQLQLAYNKFTAYFHNPEIQNNIREAKEEQFQEGFLRELFVNILGYTINPEPNFNLTTEFKNLTGSKKADGAVLKNGKALAVIELKGTDTRHLDNINEQAFNYKNNQTDCIYVITSNFEKLRFFIQNSVEHLEFNLFTLTENEFKILWLCVSAECLLTGVPAKVKEESVLEEANITKYLYKDYANFRTELWQNMVLKNPDADQLTLFKKTQKLLDRFLFIFFAEDGGLLPPNSIPRMIERWQVLKDEDAYKPLYDIFRQFFGYINTGRKGKTDNDDIFPFNGGLFLPDEILDNISIEDEVLHKHILKLSVYDFQSEVDVNILGHIFENSLNEIENVKAQIEGQETDKSKSKRKKDGIFYTPRYITKYIVENTIGKLCTEKKAELSIIDEEYAKGRRNRKKETLHKLDDQLKAYRQWLLNITICDPACGSGAFLNQALEFLIEEHRYIDELQAQLLGSSFVFPDIKNHILEKNIFGVDINDESVEIARLSLWLRTAQRGRKLTSLNNNIKCGNSLIDDPAVAGDKAFNWPNEFPEVFAKGGFDVVIGNPPYGAVLSVIEKNFVLANYTCYKGNFDIYSAFIQHAFNLIRNNGYWSYINPVSWQSGENYFILRDYLSKNSTLEIAIKLPYDVFEDAYVDTGVYVLRKRTQPKYSSLVYDFPIRAKYNGDLTTDITFKELPNSYWQNLPSLRIVLSPEFYELLSKVHKDIISLKSISSSIRGILPNENDVSNENIPSYKRYFIGNLNRYIHTDDFIWVNYGEHLKEKPKDFGYFQGERLLIRRIISRQFRIMADLVNEEFVNKKDYYNLKIIDTGYNIRYILAIVCSQLISFLKTRGSTTATKDDFAQLSLSDVREIPIKSIDLKDQKVFVDKVDIMLLKTKEFHALLSKFIKLLSSKIPSLKITNKLQDWPSLDFKSFTKELEKQKIKLPLSEQAEWISCFEQEKAKATELIDLISRTDKEIDQAVYQLYGLTEEEIKIVEGA